MPDPWHARDPFAGQPVPRRDQRGSKAGARRPRPHRRPGHHAGDHRCGGGVGARTPGAMAVGAPEMAVALTSPRLRGEVGICALFAQIPGEGAAPQALSCKFELAERPPHPDPLPASGEREQRRRPCSAHTLAPANRLFLTMAWMPQLPSTTWVTPKSTAMDISEIASSSLNPLVVIRNARILRNASLRARSIEDFS